MKKSLALLAAVVTGTVGVAPSAYARHKPHPVVVAAVPVNPRINAMGQFYATPLQPGGVAGPGLNVPGLGLASGLATGALAIPADITSGPLPGLDVVNGVVTGVTKPLVPPPS